MKQENIELDKISTEIRRNRLMQICGICFLGLLVAAWLSHGITFKILSMGCLSLIAAFGFALRHQLLVASSILLGSMSLMLFALAATGAGMHDAAVLGYPGLLIFAAVVSRTRIYLVLLFFVVLQCCVLTWLSLNGVIETRVLKPSWTQFYYILIIFIIVGASIYLLINEMKMLMRSSEEKSEKISQSRRHIQRLARYDGLTNLPNRFYGERLFNQILQDCSEENRSLAFLFINIDNFKPVNDVLGHKAGDQLLLLLSQRLNSILNSEQKLIRFGGDEFLILAPISKTMCEIKELCEDIIAECANEFEVLETGVLVSASIGLALAPEHGSDFKQICRNADLALFTAKRNGRNNFFIYDESLQKFSQDNFKLLQALRIAINEEQFSLHYQVLVGLQERNSNTVEALLRWQQKDGSFIPPDKFIPLCESTGLINRLGKWVIQQACEFCAKQRKLGDTNLTVAVNISMVQFRSGNLQEIIQQALEDNDLPSDALEIEITESVLMEDLEDTTAQLKELDALGISIAIDDFGTGYSNLGYLKTFKASKLKIDRSFIQELRQTSDDSLIKAIVNMAKSLNLEMVAEGIEDKATMKKLVALGVDIGQGYYWSKPVEQDELLDIRHRVIEGKS